MHRLWLLAALLLALLPTPAAACERAPVPEKEHYVADPGHYAGDQFRAGSGVELVAPREQGRGPGRGPTGVLPDLEARDARSLRPASSPARDGALPAPDGCTPLCERLPYQATAPPHRG
ncbi:MAG TPA: hypothetical protein VGR37_13520 [Longimicrobiaceae bacterium]|nr:hypothetical protein [Longimicrobiaceae bacterium]